MSPRAPLFLLIGLVILAVGVYFLRDILLPFILSAFFAYLLTPLIAKIESFGVRREAAVVFLFLIFFTVFATAIAVLAPRLVDEAIVLKNNSSHYISETKRIAVDVQKKIEQRYPFVREKGIIDAGITRGQKLVQEEIARVPAHLLDVFSIFSVIILIPILTFFMLLSGSRLFDRVLTYIPSRYVETGLGMVYEAESVLGKYIRGQMIETSAVGIMSITGLMVLGIDYAILIGIFAGFANMIPYLGPPLGAVAAVLVGIIKFQSFIVVVKIIILFWIIQFIDNHFIQPVVIGGGVNLSPVVMIFSLMAGAKFFGIMGLIFAVPVAGIIKVLLKILLKREPVHEHGQPIVL